jgi:hypothetical protein
MSNSSDKLKEKLKAQGKDVKEKTPIKEVDLTKKDLEQLNIQLLKDLGYLVD